MRDRTLATFLLFLPLWSCAGPAAHDAAGAATHGSEPAATDAAPAPAWSPGALGASVVLAERTTNLLRGDFNGDGRADLLAVVHVRSGDLAPHVRVVRPWSSADPVAAADDVSAGADVALAIVHSDGGVFLLHDPDPVSILDAGAGRALSVVQRAALGSLGEPDLARRARGDVVVLPTEAGIDTYLFWDGSTYRWLAPLEVP